MHPISGKTGMALALAERDAVLWIEYEWKADLIHAILAAHSRARPGAVLHQFNQHAHANQSNAEADEACKNGSPACYQSWCWATAATDAQAMACCAEPSTCSSRASSRGAEPWTQSIRIM